MFSLINSSFNPLVSQASCILTTERTLCLGHKLLSVPPSSSTPSYRLVRSGLDRNIIRAVDEIYRIVPPWPGHPAGSYLSPTGRLRALHIRRVINAPVNR